jgi:hypothetical protein
MSPNVDSKESFVMSAETGLVALISEVSTATSNESSYPGDNEVTLKEETRGAPFTVGTMLETVPELPSHDRTSFARTALAIAGTVPKVGPMELPGSRRAIRSPPFSGTG